MSFDIDNTIFQLAVQFVNQTNKHVFLTGKAGTGKTTFLKYIRESGVKKTVVVAPTGVAAINAGGVTIHSFFQLPFAPFVPVQQTEWGNNNANNLHSLPANMRVSSTRKALFREMELLIIDEVSMVRADMLDAIDVVLRHFRNAPSLPFGGVQVLYIGDLYQLPPVVKNEEWEQLMQPYYKGPFFFDAHVIKQMPPLYIELKKIYRQSDLHFINILNNIRHNNVTTSDFDILDKYYNPTFRPQTGDNYITLASHNAQANTINDTELNKLRTPAYTFEAIVSGDFSEKSFPAEKILQLKKGAQIMFIKNDKGEVRRYYNGKLGVVKEVSKEKVTVSFPEKNDDLEIEQEVWKNIRYTYDKDNDSIEEEELGEFKQYPIRLAWAITIHKSQGLTFNKAVIDAGASFAPGQVYVALSRLTSIEGLVLRSRIHPNCIATDSRVVAFTDVQIEEVVLRKELQEEQKKFLGISLIKLFDWSKLLNALEDHFESYARKQLPDKKAAAILMQQLIDTTTPQKEIADKFIKQLEYLLLQANDYTQLKQRVEAGAGHFIKIIKENLLAPVKLHEKKMELFEKKKVAKYIKSLQEVKKDFIHKQEEIERAVKIATGLLEGLDAEKLLAIIATHQKESKLPIPAQQTEKEDTFVETVAVVHQKKLPKGETQRISLNLFKKGITIAEIAEARNFTIGTIEGHLASFIQSGEITIKELVPEEKRKAITEVIKEIGEEQGTTPIKEKLGNEYSYGEIKAVSTYLKLSEC